MLRKLETEARQNLLEHEQKIIHERAAIIRAEAGSDSWLAKSWRPIMMVNFGFSDHCPLVRLHSGESLRSPKSRW